MLFGWLIAVSVINIVTRVKLKQPEKLTEKTVKALLIANYIVIGAMALLGVFFVGLAILNLFYSEDPHENNWVSLAGFVLVILLYGLILWLPLTRKMEAIKKLNARKQGIKEESVIYCLCCGVELPAETEFCPECGSKITKEETI